MVALENSGFCYPKEKGQMVSRLNASESVPKAGILIPDSSYQIVSSLRRVGSHQYYSPSLVVGIKQGPNQYISE